MSILADYRTRRNPFEDARGRTFQEGELGPNDGLTMLVDELLPGGLTIIEPGVDHFFAHPDRELRSRALLEVLLMRLGAG
jgi:hypothetical protein